jgi:hypothetical protein
VLRFRDVAVAAALIAWFLLESSLLPIPDIGGDESYRDVSYPQSFDPVYAGTEEGRVLRLHPNRSPQVLLDIQDRFRIDSLAASGNQLAVLGSEMTEQNHRSTLFLMADGTETEIKTQKHVEDILLANNNLYVTSHRHSGGSKTGSLAVYGLDGSKKKEITHKAASKMSKGDGLIAVSGDEDDIKLVNSSTRSVVSSFSHGVSVHDAAPSEDAVYLAATKRRPAAISGTTKTGNIAKVSTSGRNLSSFNLGVTSLPHDVHRAKGHILMLDIRGEIRKLDPGFNDTGVVTELPGRPVDMAVSGSHAYTLDEQNSTLGRVNIEKMVLDERAVLPGVTAVASN